ncbi:hypothetical protein [Gynuella sunshinyii]|uniref:Phage-related tail protein n=1 Tax=Gynuella sunshinyii YC6258 TaxID=1445510 RepID=A0A0C5W5B3_9GAMM|nr:hypothetical protein [Gynuella sunshinyii]AJQ97769.1 phage-related tail protein [Gynuella sunshinyii YC6258]
MPGNSWKNLRAESRPQVTPGSGATQLPANAAATSSAQMQELIQQRQQLENNLRNLVSGETQDPREAMRFQIPTFAQRQAQQRQWDDQREQQRQQAQQRLTRSTVTPLPVDENLEQNLRSGLRDFSQPVSQWMSQRDREREQLREYNRRYRDATQPLRELGSQFQSAGQQLRDLDKKLAAEGLEDDRQALRDAGMDKLLKADKTLQKVTKVIDAPSQAVAKIDNFWQRREQQISGPMDRFGPYVERSRRRLNVETGGSGNLFERMQQNRERALARRREQRIEAQRDEARRRSALQRKKEKEENEA